MTEEMTTHRQEKVCEKRQHLSRIHSLSITTLTLLLDNSVLIICTADNPNILCLAHLIQSCAGYSTSSSKQVNSFNADLKSPSFMLKPARDIRSFKLSPDLGICS